MGVGLWEHTLCDGGGGGGGLVSQLRGGGDEGVSAGGECRGRVGLRGEGVRECRPGRGMQERGVGRGMEAGDWCLPEGLGGTRVISGGGVRRMTGVDLGGLDRGVDLGREVGNCCRLCRGRGGGHEKSEGLKLVYFMTWCRSAKYMLTYTKMTKS